MRLTLNKTNWSGETITINVNQKTRSWSQFGYRFELRLLYSSKVCRKFEIWGDAWDYPLGTVTCYPEIDEAIFTAADEMYNCIRHSESPYIAAAQLLCNII